ncbi:MAG: sigma-70 family RNA polymerase sigma factor [Phycisphaeraceae bacterium]|nr:sigma-70 family RNA polymerase sigma factor [Phycisphaeraceae bacterium]
MSEQHDKQFSKKMSKLALLWGKAQPTVTAYIRSSLRDHHDSEDVTQATVQYIVEHFDEFDLSTNFVAWAIGIARYRVLECIRQRQRSARVLSEEVIRMLPDAFVAIEDKVLPQQDALEQCMGKLNDRSKDALYRKYYEGARHHEIANSLDIAPNSVTVLLRRIRETLAKCIESRMSADRGARG